MKTSPLCKQCLIQTQWNDWLNATNCWRVCSLFAPTLMQTLCYVPTRKTHVQGLWTVGKCLFSTRDFTDTRTKVMFGGFESLQLQPPTLPLSHSKRDDDERCYWKILCAVKMRHVIRIRKLRKFFSLKILHISNSMSRGGWLMWLLWSECKMENEEIFAWALKVHFAQILRINFNGRDGEYWQIVWLN